MLWLVTWKSYSIPEKNSPTITRLLAFSLALFGLYPQYRAVRWVFNWTLKSSLLGFINWILFWPKLRICCPLDQPFFYLRTILIGCGKLSGDWQADDAKNKTCLYIIEPLVESLLQVIQVSFFHSDHNMLEGLLSEHHSLHCYWARGKPICRYYFPKF